MEIMQGIESWIITIIYLGLMIFCLTQVSKKGMGFLATGFILLFLSSLGWRILPFLLSYDAYENYRLFYNILGQFNFVATIGFAIFFILGICQITRSLNKTDNDTTQTHQIKDLTPPKKFGSVGFYVSMLIIGFLLMMVGTFLIVFMNSSWEYYSDAGIIISVIIDLVGIIMLTVAWVYFVVILYRVWKFAIVESRRHNLMPSIDGPGKAVGFLFIPLFNLYWIFKAYAGLPKDLNAIARAKNINVTVSEGLGLSLAIFCLLSIIPFIGSIIGLVVLILGPIFISSSVGMCEKLSQVSNAPE